jgi:hypothetical protein
MKIPGHIVWSFDKADELDLTAPEKQKVVDQAGLDERSHGGYPLSRSRRSRKNTTRPVSAKTYKKALERLLCQAENP